MHIGGCRRVPSELQRLLRKKRPASVTQCQRWEQDGSRGVLAQRCGRCLLGIPSSLQGCSGTEGNTHQSGVHRFRAGGGAEQFLLEAQSVCLGRLRRRERTEEQRVQVF